MEGLLAGRKRKAPFHYAEPGSEAELSSDDTVELARKMRRRKDEKEASKRLIDTRHAEFWFEDGNLVVVASRTGFCVHRGILSMHSEVFRDLLTIPQPKAAERIGKSVVHLTDSPDDLGHLFRALYKGLTYLDPDRPFDLDVVTALTRLSRKYQIDSLRDHALGRLKTIYSDNFETFLVSDTLETRPSLRREQGRDDIAMVHFARLTHNEHMLPAALYLCCQLTVHSLLNGVPRSDGTLERLSAEDIERCIDARSGLARASDHILFNMLRKGSSDECQQRCVENLNRALEQVELREFQTSNHDPLRSSGRSAFTLDVCIHCDGTLKERELRARQEVWRALPAMFRLNIPGWNSNGV